MSIEAIKDRLWIILSVALYIIAFDWMYISWLSPSFGYFGFEFSQPPLFINYLILIIAWVPSLWIPNKIHRPSILLYWFLYLLTFIPSVIIPLYIGLNTPYEILQLALVLLIGITIIGVAHYVPLIVVKNLKTDKAVWNGFVAIGIAMVLYVAYILRSNIRLVGLEDVYELRAESGVLAEGTYVSYPIMLLGSCVFPILISVGLVQRKYLWALYGIAGEVFLYSVVGLKSYLFSAIIMLGIYFLIRKSVQNFGLKLSVALLLVIASVNFTVLNSEGEFNMIVSIIASMLFMRTICMGGMLTAEYYSFFERNPKTYYSHINMINKFVDTPYGNMPIGNVIGYEFNGDSELNSNANFWASDGIAALGLPGIVFISLICCIVFWVLDSAAQKHDIRFAILSVTVICLALLNMSLFTTILTGGLLLLIVLLFLFPAIKSENY